MVAFGAPKNYHRLACAIEDAGFEIRDSLMWVFGTGFPKSLDVSKAIDKAAGAEREKIAVGNPVKRMIPGADQDSTGSWIKDNGREYQPVDGGIGKLLRASVGNIFGIGFKQRLGRALNGCRGFRQRMIFYRRSGARHHTRRRARLPSHAMHVRLHIHFMILPFLTRTWRNIAPYVPRLASRAGSAISQALHHAGALLPFLCKYHVQ